MLPSIKLNVRNQQHIIQQTTTVTSPRINFRSYKINYHMEHKQLSLTPAEFSEELILIDDQLFQQKFTPDQDLYLQLVKEPSFVKKQSLKYDYKPSPFVFAPQDSHSQKNEEIENFSQIGNVSNISNKNMKCSCSKTKCQKNYCECFKAGVACGAECSCLDCCNDEISLMHMRKKSLGTGCKCQKSHCMKNYCQCHSGGKKCTQQCRCLQCHNMDLVQNQQKEVGDLSKPKKKLKRAEQFNFLNLVGKLSIQSKLI